MSQVQLPAPGIFSIREDTHTVSKQWQEWTMNLKRFLSASGVKDEIQKREILLYTAGKEISDLYKETHTISANEDKVTLDNVIDEITTHFFRSR